LALNRISNLDNVDLFRNLLNLKELNLSSNFIEILNENLLKNLNKLVTLSLNTIFLVKNYSFNLLSLTNNNDNTTTLANDCNLTLSFIHFNFKSDLDLFFYTESDCEKRFLVKAQFRVFKICPNKLDSSQVEIFLENWNFEILIGILCFLMLSLFFSLLFLCVVYFNLENKKISSPITLSKLQKKVEAKRKASKASPKLMKKYFTHTVRAMQIQTHSENKRILTSSNTSKLVSQIQN
jgi:hypothetical protein